ncbi:MAG: hypothetical protein H6735_04280 [Alphaproteobacteria bacterium]|nr:hypothetical protein [Alphaproteobacteria bacterium]
MWWLGLTGAWAWEPAELRPIELGKTFATSPSWDGAPAWFVGDERGLRVLDPADGHEIARTDVLHPAMLAVAELDGTGEPEVLVCGPEGISLVRGSREGLALPRPLSDDPCEALAVYDLGTWPALVSLAGGRMLWWKPTQQGLVREDGIQVSDVGLVASSGRRIAVVRADEGLQLYAPDEERRGPVIALASGLSGDPPGFVWLTAGERVALHVSGRNYVTLDEPATGVVSDGSRIVLLDAEGRRLRWSEARAWTTLPVAPVHAEALDADGDGCTDLLVADADGHGAQIRGSCADEVAAALEGEPEIDPVGALSMSFPDVVLHPTPDPITLGGPWPVVNVRVGERLTTRVVLADGMAATWRSEGGPPGFEVAPDGTVQLDALPSDLGRWRVAVRAGNGPTVRWTGFELDVWPADTRVDDVVTPLELVADAGRAETRPLVPNTSLWIGLGAAGAVAKTNGTTWEHLGEADTRGAVSPMGSLTAEIGTKSVRGFAGLDSAPFATWASDPQDGLHVLAGTVGFQAGSPSLQVGPYGTLGWAVGGLGVRLVSRPFEDFRGRPTGFELRALWIAPQLGGELAACWLWQL